MLGWAGSSQRVRRRTNCGSDQKPANAANGSAICPRAAGTCQVDAAISGSLPDGRSSADRRALDDAGCIAGTSVAVVLRQSVSTADAVPPKAMHCASCFERNGTGAPRGQATNPPSSEQPFLGRLAQLRPLTLKPRELRSAADGRARRLGLQISVWAGEHAQTAADLRSGHLRVVQAGHPESRDPSTVGCCQGLGPLELRLDYLQLHSGCYT